jgi:hypothetical protein
MSEQTTTPLCGIFDELVEFLDSQDAPDDGMPAIHLFWTESARDFPEGPFGFPQHRRKVGRNAPGPCGSGRKAKRCCGAG